MARYEVNVGITYWIDANNELEAHEEAHELVKDDWGVTLANEAWYAVEEMDKETNGAIIGRGEYNENTNDKI